MVDIVRAGALWGYSPLVRSFGGNPEALLQEVGLSSLELDDHDNFVLRRTAQDLLELTAERLDRRDFGLQLAGSQDIYVLGALAFAIRNARDLRDALDTMARHIGYYIPRASLVIETFGDGEEERIVFQGGAESPRSAGQAHELAISTLCRIVGKLTSIVVLPVRVHFRHEGISPIEAYTAHFGVVPEFEMDADGIVVRRQDLQAPIEKADPELKALVERFLAANSPSVTEQADQQVRDVLCRLARIGEASLIDVAEVLRVHPRTLQRKLGALGTSYKQIRDGVRRDLAEIYLAHDAIPIAQVAQLLGYADQPALTRGCLRWFGKTPTTIRRENARGR